MTILRTEAEVIRHTIKIVIAYFKGDTDKASLWLNSKNNFFADKKPIYYLYTEPETTESDIQFMIDKGTL